jgi:hypothetical protein
LWITFQELVPGPAGHESKFIGPNARLQGVWEFQPPKRCWRNIQMIRILMGINIIKNGIFPFFLELQSPAAPGYTGS